MENAKNQNLQSMGENMFKVFLISEVPKLAKLIVDSIPDLTYERYIKDHKSIWNMAFPAVSLAILQNYAGSELEKTFVVQMSAGINRAINERAAGHNSLEIKKFGDELSANTSNYSIFFAMTSLGKEDLLNLTKLISTLPENQRSQVLSFCFCNKTDAEEFVKTLSSFDQEQFKAWLEVMFPEEKPKEKNEFEKQLADGWSGFAQDVNAFFQKDSFFVRMAKQKGLM